MRIAKPVTGVFPNTMACARWGDGPKTMLWLVPMRDRLVVLVAAIALAIGACSADPTTSDEYLDLQERLASAEQQVAEKTAERDALVRSAEQPPEESGTDPVDWSDMPYSVERGDTAYFHETLGTGLIAANAVPGFSMHRFSGSLGGEQHLFSGRGEAGEEDLVLVHRVGVGVTDSLLLTSDTEGVHLGVACAGSNPVVLFEEPRNILRAWKTTTDGLLYEIDPADVTPEEAADACAYKGGS